MNAALPLPFHTAFDPPQLAEGNLDPLGLYAIADALGVRLAPGVRERQSRPRYLTLALVGHAVRSGVDDEGSPRRPPAWLVYEWLVVAALVSRLRGTPELQGIPGREKVKACLDRGEAVCAGNYLKTPSVFGFHGIYRVLGVKAGLFEPDGHLLEPGRRVLRAWQRDQRVEGFLDGRGDAARFAQAIRLAVRKGQEQMQIDPPAGSLADWITAHLNPNRAGPAERDALWDVLVGTDALRGEYARALVSPAGREAWAAAEGSEARYHAAMLPSASGPMQLLLRAIRGFERLARLLVDAFDEARHRMSGEPSAVDAAWLGRGPRMREAAATAPAALADAASLLADADPAARLRLAQQFDWIGRADTATGFATLLIDHHARVQRNKPPNGKRPWVDAFTDGRMAIRPQYRLDAWELRPGEYVHAYRARPILDFARDLWRLPGDAG